MCQVGSTDVNAGAKRPPAGCQSGMVAVQSVHGRPDSGAWFVAHTSVATSELTNPSLNRVDINCLGSVNVHQASVNVDWFNFFWVEEFHDASLLLTHFHDRGCFLRLSHRQYLQQRDKNFRILARRFSHHNNAISNPLGPLGAE